MTKSQASLEFLVNYGWALMIVIVIIGASVTYFRSTPSADYCVGDLNAHCREAEITSNQAVVILENTGNTAKTVTNATFETDTCSDCADEIFINGQGIPYTIRPGERYTIVFFLKENLTETQRARGEYDITYIEPGRTLTQRTRGTVFTGTVRREPIIPREIFTESQFTQDPNGGSSGISSGGSSCQQIIINGRPGPCI